MSKSEFWRQRIPFVSSVVQKVSPIEGKVLILCFIFTFSPKQVLCMGSYSHSDFFHAKNEVLNKEGSASVFYNRLKNLEEVIRFFNKRYCSLGASFTHWVHHEKARDCINNQEAMKISIASHMKETLLIKMDRAEWNILVLPIFQWNFISVLWLRFAALGLKAISSQWTNPPKCSSPVVESSRIVVGFGSSHLSNHFVRVSESKTGYENWQWSANA